MEQMKYEMRLVYAILNGAISDVLRKLFEKNFASFQVELSSDEWTVLNVLWHGEGATQMQLCNAILKDKPTMSKLLASMERKELVSRRNSIADHRKKYVYLTQKSRNMREKCSFIANKTLKQALRGLNVEELLTAQDVFRTILNNSKT